MKQFGISHEDIATKVETVEVSLANKKNPAIYATALADLIAKFFECGFYFGRGNVGKMVFYGLDNRPEIASYAYSVLLRQLVLARKE